MKHIGVIQDGKNMKGLKPFDSSRCRIVRCNWMWCAIGGDLLQGLPHLLLHLLLLLLVCGGQKLFGGILVAVRLPHVH